MLARTLPFGLTVIAIAMLASACSMIHSSERVCEVCRRPMHDATAYEILLSDERRIETCCPRCGQNYLKQAGASVLSARVADFNTGTLIDAREAIYLEGSNFHRCCQKPAMEKDLSGTQYVMSWDRCLPSLIAFSKTADADRFARKHGGRIRTFSELWP